MAATYQKLRLSPFLAPKLQLMDDNATMKLDSDEVSYQRKVPVLIKAIEERRMR